MMRSSWFVRPIQRPHSSLRLFCFPHAAGNAAIYGQWQRRFPNSIEVIPVELPGRGGRIRETPFCRLPLLIEVLADAIAPLLDVDCAFFGHSMGAMISFELARELRRRSARELRHMFAAGRRAPQLPNRDRITYNLPDDELITEFQKLNGTPPEVLEHQELMQMMLPLIRADFELVQTTYQYVPGQPLRCPITACGGMDDVDVPPSNLEPWKEQTVGKFQLRILPGDHFFLTSSGNELLNLVARALGQ